MPAYIQPNPLIPPASYALGPQGPFPDCLQKHALERRWLHYALLSRDGDLGLVANVAWLGSEDEAVRPRMTAILLIHKRGEGWRSSQFNADTSPLLWSAFRQPHALELEDFMLDGPPPELVPGALDAAALQRMAGALSSIKRSLDGQEAGSDFAAVTVQGGGLTSDLPPLESGFYLYQNVALGVWSSVSAAEAGVPHA